MYTYDEMYNCNFNPVKYCLSRITPDKCLDAAEKMLVDTVISFTEKYLISVKGCINGKFSLSVLPEFALFAAIHKCLRVAKPLLLCRCALLVLPYHMETYYVRQFARVPVFAEPKKDVHPFYDDYDDCVKEYEINFITFRLNGNLQTICFWAAFCNGTIYIQIVDSMKESSEKYYYNHTPIIYPIPRYGRPEPLNGIFGIMPSPFEIEIEEIPPITPSDFDIEIEN